MLTLSITANQLILHALGDYIFQSDWMANTKTKSSVACLAHVVLYTLPFLLATQSPIALTFIATTHFIIDRWRLARYLCYVKNFLGPKQVQGSRYYPWAECSATGYHKDRPAWMTVWLMIIADNTIHIICNSFAVEYL